MAMIEYKHVCEFYYDNPSHFNGCPGLDDGGDNDNCGECKYRLENMLNLICLFKSVESLPFGTNNALPWCRQSFTDLDMAMNKCRCFSDLQAQQNNSPNSASLHG